MTKRKVKDLLATVVEGAVMDAKAEKVEEIKQSATQAINGPVVFSVESQPFKIPEQLGRESYALQKSEIDVYRKWKNVEEDISDFFQAPDCYADITSVWHKGLMRFLEITSPMYMTAFSRVQELAARSKRGSKLPSLSQQEEYELDGVRGRLNDANRAIKRAYETIKGHYENRMAAQSGEMKPTRQRQSPRAVIDKAVATLQRMIESSKIAPVDKDWCRDGLGALRWLTTYRDDFQASYAQHVNRVATQTTFKKENPQGILGKDAGNQPQ